MAAITAQQDNMNVKRVLVVDDTPIVRLGLAQLINRETDLMVCAETDSAQKVLEAIAQLDPDIVLVDISLEGRNGLELIKNINIHYARLPILVMSQYDESLYAERALRAGAMGYIMKDSPTERILDAIRNVLDKNIYVSDKMTCKLLQKSLNGKPDSIISPIERLSDRELEVFQLLGRGYGTSQIAEKLHLSVQTIGTYREHLKSKLNLKNATELIQYSIQWAQGESML